MGVVLVAASVTVVTGAVAQGVEPERMAVRGTHPGWAVPGAEAGAVPGGESLNVRVYLAGRDPAGLAAYAAAVSDPAGPEYGRYLTPDQYRQRFGPTEAQVRAVTGWLSGAGLRVTGVTGHYVAVRGAADAMGAAFGTRLREYRTPDGVRRAPEAAVTVPAAVAPAVLTVSGLATGKAKITSDVSGWAALPSVSTPGPVNVGTCSAYAGEKAASTLPPAYGRTLDYSLCGYVPSQLRAAYQVAGSRLTGRGVTVATVVDNAPPTLAQDLNTYAANHGEQPLRRGQLVEDLSPDIAQTCQPQSAYVEQALDLEAVHAMAPDANLVYEGTGCGDSATEPLDAETRVVDGHLADIVSNSWHLGTEQQMTPDVVPSYEQVFLQGAVEGIGFYYSSGDHGDWSPFTPDGSTAVQYPGSDPWVTGVGGTSLAVDAGERYRWESGWGNLAAPLSAEGTSWAGLPGTFDGGAGGGPSVLFGQPSYQRGVVPGSLSGVGGGTPVRVMPDVAAVADDRTGMLIGLTAQLTPGAPAEYVEGRVGGTSLATPLFAGIQADAQQARLAAHGRPLGFANPALYRRYRTPAYRDVTDQPFGPGVPVAMADEERELGTGQLTDLAVTMARDTSLHATRGYDDVTGMGTPTRAYLDSYR
jgi:subtilase family serine protease